MNTLFIVYEYVVYECVVYFTKMWVEVGVGVGIGVVIPQLPSWLLQANQSVLKGMCRTNPHICPHNFFQSVLQHTC